MTGDFNASTLAGMALAIQYVMRRLEMFPPPERRIILDAAKAFLDRYGESEARAA